MNFRALILCLFIGANFELGLCNVERGSKVNYNLDNPDRWQKELSAFIPGLQWKHENGTLINLLIDTTAPTDSQVNKDDVKFLLYTQRNPTSGQLLKINRNRSFRKSNYDATKRTFFITHGWLSTSESEPCTLIRDAYLARHDVNVIVVDWGALAMNILYPDAAIKVPAVAGIVSDMINYMSSRGFANIYNIILVGHSMGAHIVGIAGNSLEGKLEAIFGLDPARPLFTDPYEGYTITQKDAKHVQIVYTNKDNLGISTLCGDANFLMSGGITQNGCLDLIGICSHTRAYKYFAESINSNVKFYGTLCHTPEERMQGACRGPERSFMGGFTPDRTIPKNSVFTVPVHANAPYAVG